jgi:type I restriction enzyme S subunit
MVDFDGLCSADMYPIEAKGNTKYLFYYMLSDEFLEQASSAGSRSVLPKINQKELSALKVSITSIEEQDEVVRILDRLLPLAQQAREKAIQVIETIDLMKKSILAKAFRGELGTNNPEEESSIELLKDILANQ